jgi:phosphopantothenoylcysteine decarboxylase/phosphopantothenate--cysteine ligase
MFNACHQFYSNVDVVIAAAAVADYRPKLVQLKRKKSEDSFVIELEKTARHFVFFSLKKNNSF